MKTPTKTWKRRNIYLLLGLLIATVLSACQQVLPLKESLRNEQQPGGTTTPTATATITPTFLPLASATPGPTILPTQAAADIAIGSARAYFAALEAGDFQAAAGWYSGFSLMIDTLTRGEAAEHLRGQALHGDGWSDLQVKETQAFDEKTILVHVTYQLDRKDEATGEANQTLVDEWWPLRLENGGWYYNRGNIIDYRTLEISKQSTGGLTVKPRQMIRYSDRIELIMLVQNQTNEPIVLGQVNEVLATFVFGAQRVEAEKAQYVFDRLRSYPDTVLEVKGLYPEYPDEIILRQWKNVNTAPWFDFLLVP